MDRRTKADWSSEAKDTIANAFTITNLSYDKIARAYSGKLDGGRPLTRNMVAGVLSRLGITCRSSGRVALPTSNLTRPKRVSKTKAATVQVKVSTAPRPSKQEKLLPIQPAPRRSNPDVSLNVMLPVLEENGCRFETAQTNDGVALFCGHKCDRLPAPRSGRRFYAFCPEHRLDCEDPRSASKIRSHNSSTKYLLSRLQ